MMGVIKLLDHNDKMVDQTLWFGGDGPLTFGKANRRYVVGSAWFIDGTGIPQLICDYSQFIYRMDRPVIIFNAGTLQISED